MKKLFALALAAVLALTASLPALAAPELPDGKISIGHASDVLIVSPDGQLVTWGPDELGFMHLCGIAKDISYTCNYSNRITIMDGVKAVYGAQANALVLMEDGTLCGLGADFNNSFAGQAPRDWFENFGRYNKGSLCPVKIMDDVVMASAGYSDFTALKDDGSVWMWGRNADFEYYNPIKIMDGCRYAAGYYYVTYDGDFYTLWDSDTRSLLGEPEYVCSGVVAAHSVLIHMENGELYDTDEYTAALKNHTDLPKPIACNVCKLCPGGYITEDGALYMRLTEGEYVKLLDGGVESAYCVPDMCIAIMEDGLVYASEIGSGYETLACVGTVDDLAPEYDPPLNPWPLILGVANKIFELIPLLAVI